MYYLDRDMNIHEANETSVYRVFGGDSSMEGGYVTCELPKNPIQARSDLALSQHDFLDDEGTPVRNLASQVATGTIFTDDEDHVINLSTEQVTDNVLHFSVVDSTSDMSGGGLEYKLEDDFADVVQVDRIDELHHQPTDGWTAYVEKESELIDEINTDDEVSLQNDSTNDSINNESRTDPDEDMDESCLADDWYEESSTNSLAIDDLLDEEEYFMQKNYTDNIIYDDAGWTDPDEGMDERCVADEWYEETHEEKSLDSLIDDELYDVQSRDVEECRIDTNDYTDANEAIIENVDSNDNY